MKTLLTALALSTALAGAAFAADTAKPTTSAPATPSMSQPSTVPSTGTTTAAPVSDVMKLGSTSGIVKSFDATSHKLTLADNQSFLLDQGMKGKDLKADQHVSITFKQDGEKKIVTQYKIEKQETAPTQG
jgi:opacity protein-like surface antigen